MSLTIENVLIDCLDLEAMSTFWCEVLGFEHIWTGPTGGYLLAAKDGSGQQLALMPRRSRDRKVAKNRIHLDLRPDDQQAEALRLERLGAKRVDIGQADTTWIVMADPEGNEFCLLRSRVTDNSDELHG